VLSEESACQRAWRLNIGVKNNSDASKRLWFCIRTFVPLFGAGLYYFRFTPSRTANRSQEAVIADISIARFAFGFRLLVIS